MTNWIHFATSWGHHKTSLVCFPHSPLLYEKSRGGKIKKQEGAEKPSKAEIDEKIWRFWTGTCGFCAEPRMAEKQLHVYSLLFFVKGHWGVPTLDLPAPHLAFFIFWLWFSLFPPEYLKHVGEILMWIQLLKHLVLLREE